MNTFSGSKLHWFLQPIAFLACLLAVVVMGLWVVLAWGVVKILRLDKNPEFIAH